MSPTNHSINVASSRTISPADKVLDKQIRTAYRLFLAVTASISIVFSKLNAMLSPHQISRRLLVSIAVCLVVFDAIAGRHAEAEEELRPLPLVAQFDNYVQAVALQEPANSPGDPELIETPIPSQDSELTLEQLEQLALANNPTIAQAAAKVRALRGKWVQVGLPPNPTVGYVSSEIGNEGAAGQQGGFVGQRYVTGGKLRLNRNIVSQEVRSAEQRLAAQQLRVKTDVRLGYYSVLTTQRKRDLAQELVDVNSRAVEASEHLLEAQEISRVALLQTKVQLNNASILLQRSKYEWQARWRQLAAVVGESAGLEPQLLAGNLDTVVAKYSWENQLTRITTESPEIAEAIAELQRTRWQLNRATAEVRPDINTQLSVQFDDSTNNIITGVQLGIALPIWNRNQGGIRQARAEISAAQQNIERVELNLKRRLAEAFQSYADARFQVDAYSSKIVPQAKDIFDLVRTGYEQGEVGYLDLLVAQRTYAQTSLSYIDAQQTLWQSAVRIEGLLLESSLQTP